MVIRWRACIAVSIIVSESRSRRLIQALQEAISKGQLRRPRAQERTGSFPFPVTPDHSRLTLRLTHVFRASIDHQTGRLHPRHDFCFLLPDDLKAVSAIKAERVAAGCQNTNFDREKTCRSPYCFQE